MLINLYVCVRCGRTLIEAYHRGVPTDNGRAMFPWCSEEAVLLTRLDNACVNDCVV